TTHAPSCTARLLPRPFRLDIVNRRLAMTTAILKPNRSASAADPAACCPREGSGALDRLASPVGDLAADEELAAFAKALGHPVRVRILRMLARKNARMCSHIV